MKKVFILGNPRSGTSLFRLMLNQHSKIVAPPESGFMQWWFKKYKNWDISDNFNNRINEFLDDLYESRKFETWKINRNALKEIILLKKPKDYAQLTECVYLAYDSNPENIKIIADKNNYYINHLTELKKIWPDAKFIHIIRDGRDVACSYLDMSELETDSPYKPNLPENIRKIAKDWVDNNNEIAALSKKYPENYILIKYEDLIIDSRNTLANFCDFLGIEFDHKMLDYYKPSVRDKSEPKETLDWKKKTLEKPDLKRIGRYSCDLKKKQIELFNNIALPSLKLYGYE